MPRSILRRLIFAGIAGALSLGIAAPANAQGPLERLFDRIMGGNDAPAPAAPAPSQPRVIAAPAPAAEKNEEALTLLVVGDFLARGVADALEDALADEPGIVVVDRSNGSSGIVRDDFYDWSVVLPDLIDELEPAFVVMMIGTNDRQEMRTADGRFDLRSEGWDAAYAERVDALAAILAPFGEQAIWIGQPPMRSRSMSADMAYFNSLYDAAAERYGIAFLDIWDAFADQEGRYTVAGPDVDGQTRTLRADDGFSFTAAGRAKVAFFVEGAIDLAAGEGGFVLVPDAGGVEIENGVRRVVGPVLVLGDPPAGASAELMTTPVPIPVNSLLYRFFVRGEPLPNVPGRADDFSWPRARAPIAGVWEEAAAAL